VTNVQPLTDGWTLRPTTSVPVPAEPIAASVPGCVHTDLLAAGLIPDPYLDENEKLLQWVGQADWEYRTERLPRPEGERVHLVFDGLDTIARVSLGEAELGRTQNMHRTYRFDVTDVLADDADLVVSFSSAVRWADAAAMAMDARPHVNHHPYNAIRKMACSFGWDWGLDTATQGIWRGVRLEGWSTARLARVLVRPTVQDGVGVVSVPVQLERTTDADVTVRVRVGDTTVETTLSGGQTDGEVSVRVENPDLWWPRGYGEQPLYDVTVRLLAGNDVLDETTRRIGFRTLTWDMTPDADGTPFQLVVNGQKVLVKGYNWIPDDAFPHRVTPERYRARFEQMVQSNANLVRVWGGGIYEDDAFFAAGDELGILTWQDFLLACAAYPEEEPYRSEFEAEAHDNVARIAHHASLALINGNNENIWGHADWGWDRLLDGRTWGHGYYYELFPSIVAEVAPHVPYTPGSPFSPDPAMYANEQDHGTMHLWDTWNQAPATTYRDHHPRFVAEFGWQGPPTWSTLTAAVHDDPMTPESPGVFVHQKAASGNDKLTAGLLPIAPLPRDMERWHWAMQYAQAESVRVGISHLLAEFPRCSGMVYWQINDCWPVISWAAVDGYGRPKPLLYAIKKMYAPRYLTLQPAGEALELTVLNDTADAWTGEVALRRHGYNGSVLADAVVHVEVAPRSSVKVEVPGDVATPGDPASELVCAQLGDVRTEHFFAAPRDAALEPADVSVSVSGDRVTVQANNLVREVALLVDKVDPQAQVDDMLVTLLPGEAVTFTVSGASVDAEQARRVLVSVNDLV